jgi:hypothetical protein
MSVATRAAEDRGSESRAIVWPGAAALDTSEVRWFAPGPVPADVLAWFTRIAPIAIVDERCDTYLLHNVAGLGVESRSGRVLEVKQRHCTGPEIVVVQPIRCVCGESLDLVNGDLSLEVVDLPLHLADRPSGIDIQPPKSWIGSRTMAMSSDDASAAAVAQVGDTRQLDASSRSSFASS